MNARISENDIQAAREADIYELYARLGYDPPRKPGGVANSPFRDDGTASLQVGGSKNICFDHGTGETWNPIDLVQKDKGFTFEEAVSFILGRQPRREEVIDRKKRSGPGKIVATYDYLDPEGTLLYQVVRMEPKSFRQRRPDGNGWAWNLQGVDRVLFQLPQVLEAVETGKPVFILEGEKDVLNLGAFGLVGTTNAGGANSPWEASFSESLRGGNVIVIPDNDGPGEKHALEVAESLHGIAASVRVLRLPGLGAKEDFSDWQAKGGTKEEFLRLVEQAPPFEPEAHDPIDAVDAGPVTKEKAKALHPTREAAAIVASRFSSERGRPTLRRWGETWYTFDPEGLHYRPLGIDALRKEVWLHLEDKIERPTGRMRDDLVSGLLSVPGVLIDSEETPAFLDGESGPSRDDGIDVSNGVLDSRNRTIHPASESLFRLSAPSFQYDPEAGEPERFNRFLEEIGFDESERSILFEWFGLCLTRDTSLQKIMFIEGPPRSGKSTLIRLLEKLLGPGESAAMTPQAFSERFGLSSLVGKRAGFIADGKWPHPLPQPMTARLLGVSGEDTQLTEAKYAPAQPIRLGARITLVSNEPLPLDSGLENLRSRIIRLETKNSFLGREDSRLIRELESELPAIFLQCLNGLDRLRRRGRFPSGFEIPRRAGEADLAEWIIEQARPVTESEIHRSGPGGFRRNWDAIRAACSKLTASGRFAWVDMIRAEGGRPTRGIVFLGDGGLSSAEVI